MRAKGMGADVIVTEIDPSRRIEAVMDGFRVMPMAEAAKIGDIFVTVTGNKHVIAQRAFRAHEGRRDHLQLRPLQRRDRYPGAGKAVQTASAAARRSWKNIALKDGRRIYLLGEGRLINLAAAEGHPASVMDMSFANQALSAEYMMKNTSRTEAASLRCARSTRQRDRQAQAGVHGRARWIS